MSPKLLSMQTGIGATDELTLRVSVAALVRVLFEHPGSGITMLALERRVTLHQTGYVEVKSQPFGGALRIYDRKALQNAIGDFHFDSEPSRAEQDFRLFTKPSAWDAVREFCLDHLSQPDNAVLESGPIRELAEEFMDTLDVSLQPDQYSYRVVGTVVENDPSPTENRSARGRPTARIYRIFEARIVDSFLAEALRSNSENYSDHTLSRLALDSARRGEVGKTSAVLTLPYEELQAFYRSVPPKARNQPVIFQNHRLDETVTAVLEELTVPRYQSL